MEPDLRFAHELADAADAVTVAGFRAHDLDVTTKADSTPVSAADRGAEEAIRSLVASRRSGETVFGEEHGDDGGDIRWIVDPIDGTRNYIRGIPVWATLIALEREGVVDVAVVSAPMLGRRWWGTRGGGSYAQGERCSVSNVARLEDAVVSTTSPLDMPPGWTVLSQKALAVRGFSDFWQHCLVAEGAVDIATDNVLGGLWDYAAIGLIVAEAGGRCSRFDGGEPLPEQSFLSTNGMLHDAATSLLASAAAS